MGNDTVIRPADESDEEPVTFTPQLRWAALRGWEGEVVRGVIPGYPENGPTYYKLQQLCIGADGLKHWQDVEIES